MRRTVGGWILIVSGFLACPCHLPLTLPLAVVMLSGTAPGGWLANHEGVLVAAASLYFLGALALGACLSCTSYTSHSRSTSTVMSHENRTESIPSKHCLVDTVPQ
jgi:hypothetical protein